MYPSSCGVPTTGLRAGFYTRRVLAADGLPTMMEKSYSLEDEASVSFLFRLHRIAVRLDWSPPKKNEPSKKEKNEKKL